jgi:ferritin-like metal-binding protein YciE
MEQVNNKENARNNTMTDSLLQEFFMDELRDIYWAEKHLVKELSKMSAAASTDELKTALADHLESTKLHVKRLKDVFTMMDEKASAKKCIAIAGITKEAASTIEKIKDDTMTRDAALIMSAQKAEHYEIATYGGLVQIARTLGRDDVANKLQHTLDEEKLTDHLLSSIAEEYVNVEAKNEHI